MALTDAIAALFGYRRIVVYDHMATVARVQGLTPNDLYRQQPALRAVVSFLADNVAGVPLKCYVREGDTDRPRDTKSDLARLLSRPSKGTTTYELVRGTTSDVLLWGSALWFRYPDEDAPSGWAIRLIPWAWVDGQRTEDGFEPSAYIVTNPYTGGCATLDAGDCVRFFAYDPRGTLGVSSPIEALKQVLSEQISAWEYRNGVWKNGGRVSQWISRPAGAEWSPGARDRFAKSWKARFAGKDGTDTGGTPLLEDGMRLESTTFNAREAQWQEATRLAREDVAGVYHVNPSMIWHSESQTYASAKDNARALYADSLGNIFTMIQQRINLELVPALGLDPERNYCEFDLSSKLAASFEEQAGVLQSSVGGPFMLRNEARARMNLPALPGGDELIVPLNVTEGGLASPRDTDPTKGAPLVSRMAMAAPEMPEQLAKALADAIVLCATQLQKPQAKALPEGEGKKPAPFGVVPTVRVKARALDPVGLQSVLRRFYERQSAYMGNHLADSDVDAFDTRERWVSELASDLMKALDRPFNDSASEAALKLGMELPDIDRDELARTLREICEARADSIVQSTLSRLVNDLGSLDEWTPEAVSACVADSYARRMEQRVTVNAQALASMVPYAGTVEGARQAEPHCMKEWVVSRQNTRDSHAKMDGQRVGIDERFSNGARWPHDLNLSAAESCNCRCRVEIVSGNDRASDAHLKAVRREERELQKGINSSWKAFKTDEREPNYQKTVGKFIRSFSKDGLMTARHRAKPKGKEIQVARVLAENGHRVEFLAELGRGKHPDVTLNGFITDFKRIEAFNPDAVYKEIKRAVAQGAEQVVIDLAYDRVQLEDALRKARKAINDGVIDSGRVIVVDWRGELHTA